MNVSSIGGLTSGKLAGAASESKPNDAELRGAFDSFVGEVFFSQMLKSMRKTVGEPAYFHGGQAEEIFTERLDQVLTEKLTQASAEGFTGPMYELFTLQRS